MMIKSPVLGKPPDTGNIGHNSVLPVHWTKALNRNLSASAGPAVRQGSGAHDNAGISYHTYKHFKKFKKNFKILTKCLLGR